MPPFDSYNNDGYDQNTSQYGTGRENYERQDSQQYGTGRENYERQDSQQYSSRQGSMRDVQGGSQRNVHLLTTTTTVTTSQTHLHGDNEGPLAHGSVDHLAGSQHIYPAGSATGSQSHLNRSTQEMHSSQLRLVGGPPPGSERGSQMQLPVTTGPYDNRGYNDGDNESEIPRQDSVRLAQGGYNLELLRKSPSIPGGARMFQYLI